MFLPELLPSVAPRFRKGTRLKKFLISLAAALALAAPASAQEEGQTVPAQGEDPRGENSVEQMVDIYATVLFAADIERRCDHLESDMEIVLFNNLITIENYIANILPPRGLTSIRNGAAKEAADEEANPCGEQTKEFISRVFPVAANIALNILDQSRQRQAPADTAGTDRGTAVPEVTLGEGEGAAGGAGLDLGPEGSEESALDLGQAPDDPDEE